MSDQRFLERAVALALSAEAAGNLPIGAVIVLADQVIAEGANRVVSPTYHPGKHAEMQALQEVPPELWPRAREMTCYTTLEPCLMCFGSLLLHGVGRIVFGAHDLRGGAGHVLPHLPPYYQEYGHIPLWEGPIAPKKCDPLYQRAHQHFIDLPGESTNGQAVR